jgi:3-hydroxyisobutyrate dehydrogenase
LLLMAAGPDAVCRQLIPVLQDSSEEPRRIGTTGKVGALKLALNQLLVSLVASFGLSLAMVRQAGVPVEDLMGIVRTSPPHAEQYQQYLPRVLARDFSHPHFRVSHTLKEVKLAPDQAEQACPRADALRGVRQLIERSLALRLDELDCSASYQAIHPETTG